MESGAHAGSVFRFTLPRYDCLVRLRRTVDKVFNGSAKTGRPVSAVVLPAEDLQGMAEQIPEAVLHRSFELSLQRAQAKMVVLFPGACKEKGHELRDRIVEGVRTAQRLSPSLVTVVSYPEDAKDTEGFVALLEELLKQDVHEENHYCPVKRSKHRDNIIVIN